MVTVDCLTCLLGKYTFMHFLNHLVDSSLYSRLLRCWPWSLILRVFKNHFPLRKIKRAVFNWLQYMIYVIRKFLFSIDMHTHCQKYQIFICHLFLIPAKPIIRMKLKILYLWRIRKIIQIYWNICLFFQIVLNQMSIQMPRGWLYQVEIMFHADTWIELKIFPWADFDHSGF